MNNEQRQHITDIIEAIKTEEIAKFDMQNFVIVHPVCGTYACIAGFSALLTKESPTRPEARDRELLGIDHDTLQRLFYGYGAEISLAHITQDMAIAALTDLRDKGVFTNWDDYIHLEAEPA